MVQKGKKDLNRGGVPTGSGPGIFGRSGHTVHVTAPVPGSSVMGFSFGCHSREQAADTVRLLREELASDSPEAVALRAKNSFANAERFVFEVLEGDQ